MQRMRDFCDEMEDLLVGNEIFEARTRGIGVIPAEVGLSLRAVRRQPPRQRRRLGPPPRRPAVGAALRRARLEGLDPPRRRLVRPLLGAPPGDPRSHQDRRPAARRPAERADHGEGPAHHQGARGRGVGRHREPARRDGLLRRQQGRPRTVPGEDPLGQLQQRLDPAVGARRACTSPTSSRSWPPSTSSSGTSTGEHAAHDVRRRACLLAADDPPGHRRAPRRARCPPGTFVYVFLFKMVSFMQSRLGPMEAGPYGSMQLFAEVGKFLQKEDIVPERGRQAALQAGAVHHRRVGAARRTSSCRSGPDAVFANLDVGIFFALAVSSISVIGILIAGWASANKYSLIGGLRAAGQLIAYELPLVLAVVGVVIQAGTLNLQGHRRRRRPTARSSAGTPSATRSSSPSSSACSSSSSRRRPSSRRRRSTCRSPSPSSSPAT